MSDYLKLAVPNRISIWLETQEGVDEYMAQHPDNPNYFLWFTSLDPTAIQSACKKLYDAMSWDKNKILDSTTDKKPYPFTFVQPAPTKNPTGKAGACYCALDASLQTKEAVSIIQNAILETVSNWCVFYNQRINPPQYNPDNERYMVVTVDLIKSTSL